MPIFASQPATTVRPQSPWRLPKLAYPAVFLAVGLAAYVWQFHRLPPPQQAAPPLATARIFIHSRDFAVQPVWQEVVAQTKPEVRDNLSVEVQPPGEQTVVSISLGGLPAETIVPTVNMVAAGYSQACRSQWKLQVERACSTAQQKARETQQAAQEAQSRLEALRQRQQQSERPSEVIVAKETPAQPVMVENPRWAELTRRLTDLDERRRALLLERTSLHPAVQEVEMRMHDIQREMASVPSKIAQEPVAAVPPASAEQRPSASGPSPAEMQAAMQAAERLRGDLQLAQAAERAALTARNEELRIDLQPAEPLPAPPASPRIGTGLIATSLFTAMTSVIGLGMISLGASLEPALASVGELQSLLPAPVIGVVPAAHPARSRSGLRRRLARWASILAGLAMLCAVAWLLR